MSILSEISRINGNIADAYDAVDGKGGTLPTAKNSANLPAAIESITPAKPEQAKTLTLGAAAPATVTPDSGKVLSSVPVVLDTSVIKAENIAKDVTMLGVTGTHEGGGGATICVGVRVDNTTLVFDGTNAFSNFAIFLTSNREADVKDLLSGDYCFISATNCEGTISLIFANGYGGIAMSRGYPFLTRNGDTFTIDLSALGAPSTIISSSAVKYIGVFW